MISKRCRRLDRDGDCYGEGDGGGVGTALRFLFCCLCKRMVDDAVMTGGRVIIVSNLVEGKNQTRQDRTLEQRGGAYSETWRDGWWVGNDSLCKKICCQKSERVWKGEIVGHVCALQ